MLYRRPHLPIDADFSSKKVGEKTPLVTKRVEMDRRVSRLHISKEQRHFGRGASTVGRAAAGASGVLAFATLLV